MPTAAAPTARTADSASEVAAAKCRELKPPPSRPEETGVPPQIVGIEASSRSPGPGRPAARCRAARIGSLSHTLSAPCGRAGVIRETRVRRPDAVRDDAGVSRSSVCQARHAVPRSALATCEIVTAATAAHSWAGGALPSLPWLVGVTGLVFGATVLVIRDRAPLRWVLPALAVAQFMLHGLLAAIAPAGHAHGHATGAAILDLSWQMLAAHAASAVVTALVWHLRRRLVEAIMNWPLHSGALVAHREVFRPLGQVVVPTGRVWLVGAPRRGPPAGLCCA